MIHESKGSGSPIVPIIVPELDAAHMLGALVPVVRGGHEAKWGPVIDLQWLAIQAFGEQNVVRE
jgi:hypothetical protein